MIRLRPHTLLAGLWLLALQAGFPAWAEPMPEFDHHDPAALNEAAVRYLNVGAGGTALILLERACVLQPHEPVLQANLAALKAFLAHPGTLSASAAIEMTNKIKVEPLLQLPAPWPAKPAL